MKKYGLCCLLIIIMLTACGCEGYIDMLATIDVYLPTEPSYQIEPSAGPKPTSPAATPSKTAPVEHHHDYKTTVTEPTCTEGGYYTYTCTGCGETRTGNETDALGHSWAEWESSRTATVTKNEVQSRSCTACALQETRELPDSCLPYVAPAGSSDYGFQFFGSQEQGEALQMLYLRLYECCEAFRLAEADIIKEDDFYSAGMVEWGDLGITQDRAIAVARIFTYENPQYYWTRAYLFIGGGKLWLNMDPAYATAEARKGYDAAIAQMQADCAALLQEGMTEAEKAAAIHDYILSAMQYAYYEDGITPVEESWAHNIVGCADPGRGVCDSYAKTFLYLCELNGLDCIAVTGETVKEGAGHAWNLISIDGVWYGVDCTWDDGSYKPYYYFGMSEAAMAEHYVADSSTETGMDYLYDLPKISQETLSLP